MAKSTPGPWEIKKCICGKCNVYWVEPPGVFTQGSGFKKEDARLIASAPDLLEILKRLVTYYGSDKNAEAIFKLDKAKQVIAKAEGEGYGKV